MRLEWQINLDDEIETVTWENGVLTAPYEVQLSAEMLMFPDEDDIVHGVIVHHGGWSLPASLETAEAAWGTVQQAIYDAYATIIKQPEPVFQPPNDADFVV